jgi:hypothetical protein
VPYSAVKRGRAHCGDADAMMHPERALLAPVRSCCGLTPWPRQDKMAFMFLSLRMASNLVPPCLFRSDSTGLLHVGEGPSGQTQ